MADTVINFPTLRPRSPRAPARVLYRGGQDAGRPDYALACRRTVSFSSVGTRLLLRAGLSRMAPGAAPETDLLGEFRALLGVFRRNHRIIRRQAPPGAVFVGTEIIGRA